METLSALPASIDAERSILGAILLDERGELIAETASELSLDDFSLDSHRRIYRRMLEQYEAGKPIDIITLSNAMAGENEIRAAGGVAYISSLTDGALRRSSLKSYIGIVKEKTRRRELAKACELGATMALDKAEATEACFATVEEALLAIQANERKGATQALCQFSDDALRELLKLRTSEAETLGMPTGIPMLDEMTTGLRTGELWLVGGRTGEGKSAFASQVVRQNARRGTAVGIFTVEMSKQQVLRRLWSQETGIFASKLRDPRKLDREELERLKSAAGRIGTWPVFIDDSSSLTVTELAARARLMVKRYGCRLLIVDYVQLVDAEGRDERQRVTRISRALLNLKKELGVSILALSQMPRPKQPNDRPNKYDFKESGSLENDADTVVQIYRPVNEDNHWLGEDELIVCKQREGHIGIVPVEFLPSRLMFRMRAANPNPKERAN